MNKHKKIMLFCYILIAICIAIIVSVQIIVKDANKDDKERAYLLYKQGLQELVDDDFIDIVGCTVSEDTAKVYLDANFVNQIPTDKLIKSFERYTSLVEDVARSSGYFEYQKTIKCYIYDTNDYQWHKCKLRK